MLMNQRWISLGLFLSFLFLRLAWAKHSMFMFQIEYDVFSKAGKYPASVLHPFIVLPFIGQLLMLAAVFNKRFPIKYILLANLLLGLMVLMVLLIGILAPDFTMIISTIPFLFFTVLLIRSYRIRHKSSRSSQGTTQNGC
jgi:hypothetical protein